METVNFPCPECQKLIAVLKEDLGHRLQCPLCSKVIQAPPPQESESSLSAGNGSPPETTSGAKDGLPTSEDPNVPVNQNSAFETTFEAPSKSEEESIFGPPEDTSDDVFGGPPEPKISFEEETPEDAAPADHVPQQGHYDQDTGAEKMAGISEQEPTVTAEWSEEHSEAANDQEVSQEAITEQMRQAARKATKPSLLTPLLLIFLIPYSITTTVFLGYMIYTNRELSKQLQKQENPLEKMIDIIKSGKKPRRMAHDIKLSEDLKVTLNDALEKGAVKVKPIRVNQLESGDLKLTLRLTNTSDNLIFNPLPKGFLDTSKPQLPPYIYLEGKDFSKREHRVYGGKVKYWKAVEQIPEKDPELKPGESIYASIVTRPVDRDKISKLINSNTPLTWRVHLQRGLINVSGQDWATTCVVGIDFKVKDIKPVQQL